MKRIGATALVLAAFAAGMAYVYSCGGGSESAAQDLAIIESKIDALALYVEVMDAKIDSVLVFVQNAESRLDSIQAAADESRTLDNTMSTQITAIQNTVNGIDGVVDSICSAVPGC